MKTTLLIYKDEVSGEAWEDYLNNPNGVLKEENEDAEHIVFHTVEIDK